MSNLHKTKHDSDSDSDTDSDNLDDNPELEFKFFPHPVGSINRLRVMSQYPHTVASWNDTGSIYLWNVDPLIQTLDSTFNKVHIPNGAIQKLENHSIEGFALDWSNIKIGRLITGDCKREIYLSEMKDNSLWIQESDPFLGHLSSVEDLQWSPTEADVFASCSSDQTIKIWFKILYLFIVVFIIKGYKNKKKLCIIF